MLQGGNVSWALSHVALQSSNLTEGQGLRAKSFQFQAHLIYMLFILDSVRNKGFELRRGIANTVKWKESS